ncbi:MAG: lysophospholipid acyltransferase family protein [Promethearchaeota archaeon]
MSKIQSFMLGALKASMFDSIVSTGRTLLENANLLTQAEDVFYYNYHFMVRNWFKTYNQLTITNEENVPKTGPVIFVANHRSHLDPIFISASNYRQIHWMSKLENFHQPIMKSIFSMWAAFPIVRGSGDSKAMRTALYHLENGGAIGMFPEGTRSVDDRMGHLHNGASKLAVMTGATIMPCILKGTYNVLKKGTTFPRPSKVTCQWGRPIPTVQVKGQHEDWDLVKGFTKQIEDQFNELLGEKVP